VVHFRCTSQEAFFLDGIIPTGIYLVVPDTVQELARRSNSALSYKIVDRLFWIAPLVGAKSIGLAVRLSFIFQKKHGIPIVPPLYGSLYGSVFSLSETVDKAIQSKSIGKQRRHQHIVGP
jgi:hypothetical protein